MPQNAGIRRRAAIDQMQARVVLRTLLGLEDEDHPVGMKAGLDGPRTGLEDGGTCPRGKAEAMETSKFPLIQEI